MSTVELPPGRWHSESITPDLYQAERIERVVFEAQSPFQKIEIHDGYAFGRALILDGKTQSTTADEFVYHESLVQPPMVSHAGPRSVFVAGGGEGATIREALAHATVERVTMVDIDRDVVEACREHLPDHHKGGFDDPRLELHFDDAIAHLEQSAERYDVILVDVSDPLEAGPAVMLYTREFYELVRDRLLPGGIAATHAGPTGPEFYEQCFSAIVNTMEAVFPITIPYECFIPSFGSTWGFVAGSLGPDPRTLAVDEIDSRIAERVTPPLRFYDGITQHGMTSLPKYLRAALKAETRMITREDPIFVE